MLSHFVVVFVFADWIKSIWYGGLNILASFCGGLDFRSRFKHIQLLSIIMTDSSATGHTTEKEKKLVRILRGGKVDELTI